MSALLYLTARKLKNELFELLRKPVKLIATVLFVFLIFMNFSVSVNAPSGERPVAEFRAIIFAFYILCFITETKKGFQSGGTMFSMADVNFLFISPVNSFSVLFYGMLSRLGSSLFIGVAFVYQFSLLRSFYPVSLSDMLTAVIGYGATVFVSQLCGMLIYFYTCGQPGRIRRSRFFLYGLCAFFVLLCAVLLIKNRTFDITYLAYCVTSLPMRFFPVAGWIFTAVDGFMQSDAVRITAGIAPCVLFTVSAFTVVAFSKHGYYEDVLLSAEKCADVKADDNAPAQINIRARGFKRGRGASVLLYKHFIENRRAKTALFSPSSFFYLFLLIVYGWITESNFLVLFSMSCMVSFLPVLSGRWIKELKMPWVYMMPGTPFKKLICIIAEMLPKIIIESILQCVVIVFLCDLGAEVLFCLIPARISVAFVVVGSALLMARIFNEREKNNVFLALSVLPGMFFILPSVFVAFAALNLGSDLAAAFIIMSAVNTAISLILIFFSRNLLKVSG